MEDKKGSTADLKDLNALIASLEKENTELEAKVLKLEKERKSLQGKVGSLSRKEKSAPVKTPNPKVFRHV
jgi:phage shock protein A